MEDKPRILGVDDSLTIRKALELVLKPAGYMLELAASGAEALEKARGFQPAAILLDFILPDMRGSEVCRRLATDPDTAHIPVVLISAKGAEIQQAYQDAINVAAYVVKPFTPETIIETLADVLRRAAQPVQLTDVEPAVAGGTPAEDRGEAEAAGASERDAAAAGEPAAADFEEAEAEPYDTEEWEESEQVFEPAARPSADEAPASSLEVAFEALSAGLEGVYVEEADTRRGAAADEAKSYTMLVSQLIGQLGEALGQVRSDARFALCSDGSVRSVDDVLLDAYRRLCRILFRASAAGAFRHEAARSRARVLVACHRDSELFPALRVLTERAQGSHALLVSERFRQLPMITRLYGPTHLVVDLGGGNALWDQLRLLEAMPERRRMRIICVAPGGRAPIAARSGQEAQRESAVDELVAGGPDVVEQLRNRIVEPEKRVAVELSIEDETSTPLALG
jgi:CheY-like chemotaxis protein